LSRSKRVIEWGKTALIVLLSASALLLAWQTRLFNDYFASLPIFGSVAELVWGATGTAEPGRAAIKEAARPLNIVITNEEGGRHGVRYDTDARDAVYERTSSILGEALGSASAPTEISEDEWRSALSGAGVFFEYIIPVRLSVLDGWLGARMTEISEDVRLRRIFVAFGEDRSRLYFQEHESGLYFGADTASAAGKAQGLEIYGGNGALFAFETGIGGAENAPYMLMMPGSDHPDVRSAAAGSAEELLEIALLAFGQSGESFSTYYLDDSDTLVCVGTQFNIRVFTDGRVRYRRPDVLPTDEESRSLSKSEIIEMARAITADSIGGACGGAHIAFESYESDGDTSYIVFGYYIAGGRVYLSEDRHAASITITAGIVTEAEMNFRHFSLTGEHTGLLPERQALAAAGGEFMLCYSDSGTEILHPFWVKYGFW